MSENVIRVVGAREHNLKNISVEIPRDKFVVITGLSGSGKSSLAFDTIFAEGRRRYVESLSAYARQFLGQMEKPDVDYIEGLSPAVSIDQKGTSHNPRSTVGTVTEVYDYLRLLYARAGIPHCPDCGRVVSRQSAQEIVDRLDSLGAAFHPPKEDLGASDRERINHWRPYPFFVVDSQIRQSVLFDPEILKCVLNDMTEEAGVSLLLHSWGSRAIVESCRMSFNTRWSNVRGIESNLNICRQPFSRMKIMDLSAIVVLQNWMRNL